MVPADDILVVGGFESGVVTLPLLSKLGDTGLPSKTYYFRLGPGSGEKFNVYIQAIEGDQIVHLNGAIVSELQLGEQFLAYTLVADFQEKVWYVINAFRP